jgi:hypothetical protein
MPVPVFIVCSEGGSIDRHTNMLSIFDVIEKITFKIMQPTDARPGDGSPQPPLHGRPTSVNTLRMTAVWRQITGDEGHGFEFKTTVRMPGNDQELSAGEGEFIFKTMLYRVISTFYSDLPTQSGEIVVRNAIRRLPDGEWIHQEYAIPVERLEPSANQPMLPLS